MGLMQGISAPQLTPFRADGTVDLEKYSRMSARLADAGLKGIFVCGTSGEFVNLTLTERKQLLNAAVKGSQGRCSIMFNVTAMNLADVKDLCDYARANGADCLSFTPPYYHMYDAQTIGDYFIKVVRLAGDMPVYLYNMPGMTKNPLTPAILSRVCAECGNVAGVKDSSMDHMTFLDFQLAMPRPGFELITGNDAQVLTALQAGGAGAVIAIASVFPELCQSIWDAYQAGDMAAAKAAQDKVHYLRATVRSVMPIMAHKEMLRLQGFDMGPARFPFRELNDTEKAKIKACLTELELL